MVAHSLNLGRCMSPGSVSVRISFLARSRKTSPWGVHRLHARRSKQQQRRRELMDFAATLPSGLDTVIGERGLGISGGEAQRVALARAFLDNAPLLVLDEPTAHLDAETEAALIETIAALARGKTLVLATHSPALLALCERVLFLDEGRVLNYGGARPDRHKAPTAPLHRPLSLQVGGHCPSKRAARGVGRGGVFMREMFQLPRAHSRKTAGQVPARPLSFLPGKPGRRRVVRALRLVYHHLSTRWTAGNNHLLVPVPERWCARLCLAAYRGPLRGAGGQSSGYLRLLSAPACVVLYQGITSAPARASRAIAVATCLHASWPISIHWIRCSCVFSSQRSRPLLWSPARSSFSQGTPLSWRHVQELP